MPKHKLSEEEIKAITVALHSLHKKLENLNGHLDNGFSTLNEKLDSIDTILPREHKN